MTVHRFLHLSDIRLGQEKNGTLLQHDHIRNALITDAKDKKRGPAARILITGDIFYSGKLGQYKAATEWLEKLNKACGCDETHVSAGLLDPLDHITIAKAFRGELVEQQWTVDTKMVISQ